MLKTTFRTSSLNVLARLICAKRTAVIIYDPRRLLVQDESFSFSLEETFAGLSRRLEATDPANTCLFNLSEEELAIPAPAWLVEFDGGYTYPGMESVTLSFINDKDGSPGWIYPSTLRRPRFLAFDSLDCWKAKPFKFLVRLAFFLRMPSLVRNGRVIVHYKQGLYVETLLESSRGATRDYAIQTGTAGPDRKLVVAEGQGGRVRSFLKIALGERSAASIENEYKSLCLLEQLSLKSTVIPEGWKINEHVIRVSNVKPAKTRNRGEFGHSHCQFLRDLIDASFERQYYRQMEISGETRERLRRVAADPRLAGRVEAKELFHKLEVLEEQLQATNPMVATSICHGDFTPRTVHTRGGTVFVYDWEFSGQVMPVLFDLFHYVIQEKASEGNERASVLQARLDTLMESPIPAWFLRQRGLDPALYLRLYLLHHTARYLESYLAQEVLHQKGCQLFSVWSALLGKVTADKPAAKIIRFEDFGQSGKSTLKNA